MRHKRLPFRDFPAKDFAKQRLLVAEIMVEHSLVDAGRFGDDIHPRAGEAMRREFAQCGVKDALLSRFRISGDLIQPSPFHLVAINYPRTSNRQVTYENSQRANGNEDNVVR